jgi:hypothetical protein
METGAKCKEKISNEHRFSLHKRIYVRSINTHTFICMQILATVFIGKIGCNSSDKAELNHIQNRLISKSVMTVPGQI